MRLENRNLYLTPVELNRISELKDDADALARYLGTDICFAIEDQVGLDPNPGLDIIAPWRRWLCGLTIVVEPMPFVARVNRPG